MASTDKAEQTVTRDRNEAPEGTQERPAAPHTPPAPHTTPEAPSGPHSPQDEAPTPDASAPRTWTPDQTNDDGSRTITVKRACNGCGQYVGDVTDAEMDRAIAGLPLADVRAECAHCLPLVELEAWGARTWQVTERSISRVDNDLDQLNVYAKGYWQEADGKLQVVGLRVGTGVTRVIAYFGDWLIRHPDGRFSVHTAPEAVTA